MTKKMEIFPEKNVIQKFWAAENFSGSPQIRRQVSATGPAENKHTHHSVILGCSDLQLEHKPTGFQLMRYSFTTLFIVRRQL